MNNDVKGKIEQLFLENDKLYMLELTKSLDIEEYWYNEFIWGKKEAFQEVLELMK